MIATQTKALFIDAYRDLNARKMFWVVLVLNALVIGGFGMLGVKGNRLSIANWQIPLEIPVAMFVYKWIFSFFVVGKWLTWAATILALISTASIFPDFLAGGAVDLYLSKPIGRLRLFFTKYLTGLLFVTLQVAVFTVGSFLVLGWRGGVWEPGLFLAIPIVVLFFSYLFSICVLLGVLTRSTLAAFFLTLVIWFAIFGLNQADHFLMQADEMYQRNAESAQGRIARVDEQIAAIQERMGRTATAPSAASSPDARELRRLTGQRQRLVATAAEQEPPVWIRNAQPVIFAINTVVPKTQDTIGLLDRVLFRDMAIQAVLNEMPEGHGRIHAWRTQIESILHGRSMGWILGSSTAFEALVLGLAGWRFCRQDY